MHSLRAPVRHFSPENQPKTQLTLRRLEGQRAHTVSAPDCEIRESDGEMAEYVWLDSIFADEFKVAFSDSEVLPFFQDTVKAPFAAQ